MFFVFYSKMQIEQKERKNMKIFKKKPEKNVSTDNEYRELEEEYEKVKMFNRIEFESLLNSGVLIEKQKERKK